MTRLRQPERMVLDTLVAANVARSRADALAWCVRLVGQHTGDWLSELRDAMQAVERLRAEGPATVDPTDDRHPAVTACRSVVDVQGVGRTYVSISEIVRG